MSTSETELIILKKLEKNPNLTQREMAKELNLSLGKTNYLIHSLIDKGWLKLRNFNNSNNKFGYVYLLTADGIINKTKLTKNFLVRKTEEFEKLKKEIEKLENELSNL